MKEIILAFFKSDRSFKAGMQLYAKYGHSLSLKKRLNVEPEGDFIKGVLFEQLRELAGIDLKTLNLILLTPVQRIEIEEVNETVPPVVPVVIKPASKKKETKRAPKEIPPPKVKAVNPPQDKKASPKK